MIVTIDSNSTEDLKAKFVEWLKREAENEERNSGLFTAKNAIKSHKDRAGALRAAALFWEQVRIVS